MKTITAQVTTAPRGSQLRPGDRLLCEPVSDPHPGENCGPLLIMTIDGKAAIGRLVYQRGYYLLQPLDFTPTPVLSEPSRIRVLATVTGVVRRLSV